MDHSPHVMLVGAGAEEFARLQGVELVSNEYFRTPVRQEQLHRLLGGAAEKENDLVAFRHRGRGGARCAGNVAAATSTGGMTGKRWGRVGDSPIIGAGTYASNASCAVSATGHGEYFIRAPSRTTSARRWNTSSCRWHRRRPTSSAKMKALGGNGGVIAVDTRGEVVLDFNSEGMSNTLKSRTT